MNLLELFYKKAEILMGDFSKEDAIKEIDAWGE